MSANRLKQRRRVDSISLDDLWHEVNVRTDRAATFTVEALMYQLRRGVGVLDHPDVQCRLVQLNETQIREVASRLQKLQPEIAPAWTPDEVKTLAKVWSRK